jgi:hypothetical protein
MNNSIFASIHYPVFKAVYLLAFFAFILSGCSSTKISTNTKNLKNSKYFRILADADDDPIFVKLQDDLGIDPKMERYTVTVDIRSSEISMQYVLIGDEYNPYRYSWNRVSADVQRGLLKWTGSNKENLQ